MCGMPGVEFLQHPEDDAPEPEPRHAAPRSRRDLRTKLVAAGAAVVAAAVALAVVLHSSGGSGTSAAGGQTSPGSPASKQTPKSSPKPTASPLALPATDAFGPHSSDLITVLDSTGVVTYQSPSIERLLGYQVDEIQGERFDTLLSVSDRARLMQVVTGAERTGPETHTFECSVVSSRINSYCVRFVS